ncbi:MAG: hypothetical protein ACFNKL_04305 [Treponema sp.]
MSAKTAFTFDNAFSESFIDFEYRTLGLNASSDFQNPFSYSLCSLRKQTVGGGIPLHRSTAVLCRRRHSPT